MIRWTEVSNKEKQNARGKLKGDEQQGDGLLSAQISFFAEDEVDSA